MAHWLEWGVVGISHLVAEQHSSDGRTKRDGQARRARDTQHLAHLHVVLSILGQPLRNQIANARRYMHKRSFFAKTHPRSNRKGRAYRLDYQYLEVQEVGDHKPR